MRQHFRSVYPLHLLNTLLSKVKPGRDTNDKLMTPSLVANLLVVGWYSGPAAYGTSSRIMPLRRTVLPPKIDEP